MILFDHRGWGFSYPYADIQNNNTQLLIEDIELLRAIEIGLKIKSLSLKGDSFSVDVYEFIFHIAYSLLIIILGYMSLKERSEYFHLIYMLERQYFVIWLELIILLIEIYH